jgi:hypothetical protein
MNIFANGLLAEFGLWIGLYLFRHLNYLKPLKLFYGILLQGAPPARLKDRLI